MFPLKSVPVNYIAKEKQKACDLIRKDYWFLSKFESLIIILIVIIIETFNSIKCLFL